jgi:hypothetical protein
MIAIIRGTAIHRSLISIPPGSASVAIVSDCHQPEKYRKLLLQEASSAGCKPAGMKT